MLGRRIKLRMAEAKKAPLPWREENSIQRKRIKKEEAMALAISPMLTSAPRASITTHTALVMAATQREKTEDCFFLFIS